MAPRPVTLAPLRGVPARVLAGLLLSILAPAAGAVPAAEVAPIVCVPRATHPGGGQVVYFVMTDRFANGSTANDTGGIAGGPDASGFDPTRISHYHGGDLVGLTSKLDYITGLGATAVWITPPFVNKPMQLGTAGYHGYWILDFTKIDPHLGTEAEFGEFVRQAHARGLRVYLDIVVNHTADVIKYKDGGTNYIDRATAPYRDADGVPFDPHAVAYNGLGSGSDFPRLSAEKSFAHVPIVDPAEARSKGPEWLNDVTLYHNRGNSTFKGESALDGDFVGLDDVFTENPVVVRGFIEVYGRWMERYGIDGYRIDTVKHVNLEFWEAFGPAMRERARELGRPDFVEFGEVSVHDGDVALMSEFTTTGTLDGVLDFPFEGGARSFVSQGHDAAELARVFENDAWYTDHDNNAQGATTFLGNHDDGRFGFFLKEDNPKADGRQMCDLSLLGDALLLTARGQPVLYYGDEQGMVGIGNDMGAREDMFASRAPKFMELGLLGTTRKGGDDKFDADHPFYRAIRALADLRTAHPALWRGAMLPRGGGQPHLFAFSRIERTELVEFLVAMNNSRTEAVASTLATSQPAGGSFRAVFDTRGSGAPPAPALVADSGGKVSVSLAPLQCIVWQACAPLPGPPQAPTIRFAAPAAGSTFTFTARSVDGHVIAERQELRAEVTGGDGCAEVTFVLARASRPNQFELLGTADSPPYRIFWRPPADLAPGEELMFLASVDDLRGHRASAAIDHVRVAPGSLAFGIRGARVPVFSLEPDPLVKVAQGEDLALTVSASGTGPLEYRWLHDGREIAGATLPVLTLEDVAEDAAGYYAALVHNREGTAISRAVEVRVSR
ncbi:MAG TPA: alpha-amylase family glycosyl hydrolase [Opitutaceae bacterium]